MALQQLNTIMSWPGVCGRFAGAPAVGNTGAGALDAAGEHVALVFTARQSMTISHVGFMTGTVTGAATTADVRIETVGATGLTSGSLWAANTNVVTGNLASNTWTLVALTAAATIVAGDKVAVKITYNAGTNFVTRAVNNWNTSGSGQPYLVLNQSGAAAKSAFTGGTTSIVVGNSSTSFYSIQNAIPVSSLANNTFNNTNSAKRGIRFQVPFKCRAVGIRHYDNASAGDRNVAIFDDAGSELSSSSTAHDGDHAAIGNTSAQDYPFDNPVTLSPGTWYRATIEPSSATNCNITTITLPSADYRSATPGGVNQHYTTFASAAWSDTATDTIALMDILIDQLDDGVSATYPASRVSLGM